jgi:hypothetical protein
LPDDLAESTEISMNETPPGPLQLGESRGTRVNAACYWNASGIELEKGALYSLDVAAGERWSDGRIDTDSRGYERWWLAVFRPFRRVPSAAWFALIGTVGSQLAERCVVGKSCEWLAPATGELVCFANDVPIMYWNNRGSILLTVTKLKEANASYGN